VIASDVPVASRVAQQALSLPVHPKLTATEIDTVVEAVREVLA
jgi:dTDP-4-amino-4,6-dideoxygalactose transaminase